MLLRSPAVAFLLALVAACQAAPPPPPDQEARQAQGAIDVQLQLLQSLLVSRAVEPLGGAPESAANAELAGRLATLNERLDELLQRLAAPAGNGVASDASATRTDRIRVEGTGNDADILLLQQALLVNEQLRLTILENIANVNVAGWKKRQVDITTTLHQPTGLQVPTIARIVPVFTSGTLEITERNLDLAIDGDGFLVVTLADGTTGYTRDGGLQIDADGQIVTSAGAVLQPGIPIPGDTLEISIDPEGRVCGRTASNPDTATRFGQLTLCRFPNPGGLRAVGANVLCATDASGAPIRGTPGSAGIGLVKQGFLERSNVQITNELVSLQLAERQRAVLRRALAGLGIYVR